MAIRQDWKAERAKPRPKRRRCEDCGVHGATPGYDICWRCWMEQAQIR